MKALGLHLGHFPMCYWPEACTRQAIAIVLCCPLELDGKGPLLKTQYALDAGHRELKLEVSWKPSPHDWLVFRGLEVVV